MSGFFKSESSEISIKDFNENLSKGYGPGSFGCHEALHMSQFLSSAVVRGLCLHPTIAANQTWKDMAEKAASQLEELYQSIGSEHLKT